MENIGQYRKAGKITVEVREYGKSLIKKSSSLLEVADKIEKKISELGAEPAFPVQISCDDIAAHYCPEEDDKSAFEEQLASLDVGIHVDGFIADTAVTVDLSGKYSDLVKSSEEALKEAIKVIQIGTPLNEIGRTIQETIESFGFKPIRNLTGHGLDEYNVHSFPTVPNFDNKDTTPLEKGMVIAVEPFATPGVGMIHEKGDASVFDMVGKKAVRTGFVRDIQKEIEKYNGLPFTTRWLSRKFSEPKVRYALNQFRQLGILRSYPPLVERSNAVVSQAEHTLLIDDKVEILTE